MMALYIPALLLTAIVFGMTTTLGVGYIIVFAHTPTLMGMMDATGWLGLAALTFVLFAFVMFQMIQREGS